MIEMKKKTYIWVIAIVLAFFLGVILFKFIENDKKEISLEEIEQNNIVISKNSEQEEVTDECINEWNDYNEHIGKKIEEVSNNISENDTHYLIKNVNGFIEVYYLDENNNEYLYKKTNISTDYLTEEDIQDLDVGIEVVGNESLNKMLEDFE